jgi:malonyl-ACP decarboxylase
MMSREKVCITGLGTINSLGKSIPEYSVALRNGQSGVGRLCRPIFRDLAVKVGAEIREFHFEEQLRTYGNAPEEVIRRALDSAARSSSGIQTSVACVIEALSQSLIDSSAGQLLSQRCGLIIAGHNLTGEYCYTSQTTFDRNPGHLNPRFALQAMDTDYLGTISEILRMHGEGFTVGGACASGNVALIKAFQHIRAGLMDACIVVGPAAYLSPVWMQGYCSIGAMGGKRFNDEPRKACRPFDRDHEGFIYGEGSGCLILEAESVVLDRGGKPLAEILGGAIRLDGNRLSDPNEQGEIAVMQLALTDAGRTPHDIDYINSHGSSSPMGDETEIRAIKSVFGHRVKQIWLNATKGLTGHCLSSAGVIEAITTVIQMNQGFVHPNLNLENPIDDDCRFCPGEAREARLNLAVSNSFGFGGINTSVVIKNG